MRSVELGLSVLYLSKTLMYGFWYDYVKPKCGKKLKICYMETGSFIVHIKIEVFIKTLEKMLKQDLAR